jgi:hypothetical protein
MDLPWGALDGVVKGRVVLPEADDYEEARRPAIDRFHGVRPLAVVRCAGEDDVAEALAFARAHGVGVRVRGGGHCFAGRSSTTGMIVDTTPMNAVEADGERAVIGAGARLGGVYDVLTGRGVTIPAGCGPTVGIAGLALGGGLGILGRMYGLTCDSLEAARVILADGRVVECDEGRETDLFWALRGAGAAGLGVVTSLIFRTVPAPEATSFHLTWPFKDAGAVIAGWQEHAPDAPAELAASLLVRADGDVAHPPTVHVFGAMIGGEGEARAALNELVGRIGVSAGSVLLRTLSFRETKRFLAEYELEGEAEAGSHMHIRSSYFRRSIPEDAVTELVRGLAADRVTGEARELDFSPWGGAYNAVSEDATAFVHRRERFLLKLTASVPAGLEPTGWLADGWDAVRSWATGGVYPNFPQPELDPLSAAYHQGNRDRVVRVKRRYAPEGLFGR